LTEPPKTPKTPKEHMSQPELVHGGLTGVIRQTAFEAHTYFRNGFLEKIYENSLANRLRKKGLRVAQQVPMAVRDEDGTIVGDYLADLLVEDCVVVEVKAASALVAENDAQLLNYLKASGLTVGVLINFGTPKLQFRRIVCERYFSHTDG
jgi:GxxExxY protein